MTLSKPILERLAKKLKQDLEGASSGHCLRVDDLYRQDAEALCRTLGDCIDHRRVDTYVLGGTRGEKGMYITPERAVELRNRKKRSMCLFVPSGMVDAAASSLTNSFSVFDLKQALKSVADDLVGHIPEELGLLVSQVRTATSRSKPAVEDWAGFLAAVSSSPDRDLAVGPELWRVGLIPDFGGADLEKRLEHNAKIVEKLVHPTRAQASLAERVNGLRLRAGDVRDAILEYLTGKRLRDSRAWLQGVAESPWCERISFHLWTFEDVGESNLEGIDVASFLNKEGKPESWSYLSLQEGLGSPIVAYVGTKGKVGAKWSLAPTSPTNIKKWRIQVIPSRSERLHAEPGEMDLPQMDVHARVRKGTIPLNIDLKEMDVRAVQIRVSGVGENDLEVQKTDGTPVEGLSEEFWLTDEQTVSVESGEPMRRETVSNLSLGRLKACVDMDASSIRETSWQWIDSEPEYFSVSLNGRVVSRMGVISRLQMLERRVLSEPDRLGRILCELDRGQAMDPDRTTWAQVSEEDLLSGFMMSRREVFKIISEQGKRGLVETCDWSETLSEAVRSYACAYKRILHEATGTRALVNLLSTDTVDVRMGGDGKECRAILILPTHPLRLLWYAAYAGLLRAWEVALLGVPLKQRRRMIDLALLSNVTPANTPAFIVSSRDGEVFPYAQDLQFFWGIALPADSPDPSRCISEVSKSLGITALDQATSGFNPKRLADELLAYRSIHPYLTAMRINLVNTGSGSGGIISEALEAFSCQEADAEDVQEASTLPRFDVLSHVQDPSACERNRLAGTQRLVYESQRSGKGHHLAPVFSLYIRPINQAHKPPGGDVNLTIIMDKHAPKLETSPLQWQESASFHGLISRFVSDFETKEGECVWRHGVSLGEMNEGAEHPCKPEYTRDLVDLHRLILGCVARLLGAKDGAEQPSLNVVLTAEERVEMDRLHHISDWVISLDRFLGVELFDDPGDADLSSISRKYLLDHVPEFMEGLGRRMIVTTSHRSEIEEVLGRAMDDLGFGLIDESVGDVLDNLKTVSGRLAIRILGDEARAREAVSLGVTAAWLRAKGELEDAILIPVDLHPEMFGEERNAKSTSARPRCDLIRLRLSDSMIRATFIEVKSRGTTGQSQDLLQRMLDQMTATETAFKSLFFSENPQRVDHCLQRAKLVNVMRFYLRRARRYGLVESAEEFTRMMDIIQALEHGEFVVAAEKVGFVVSLNSDPRPPQRIGDAEIRFITHVELGESGLCGAKNVDGVKGEPCASASEPMVSLESEPQPQMTERTDVGPICDSVEMPRRCVQETNGEDEVESLKLPQAAVEESLTTPERICVPLGLSDLTEETIEWRAGVKGSPHLFILGIPGQGKSVTVTRILSGLAQQGLPAVVIDFHGQFGALLPVCSQSQRPVVIDATKGMPFSPFEADATRGAETWSWKTNSYAVAEIFEHVCKLGEMQRDVVYEAISECYRDLGFEEGSPRGLPTTQDLQKKIEVLQDQRGTRNVLPRCRSLLDFGLFQEPVADARRFESMLKQGIVIDVHALGLETLQLAAGAFLLRKIYKDMFRWGEADRLRLAIVLDEAHRLAKDVTLPKIMKEGRKFGVVVIVASQGLADFHQDVVGNAGTKIVFRTNHPQSKKVAGFLKARKGVDLATEMEQLAIGQAIIQSPDMPNAVCVRMFGPA